MRPILFDLPDLDYRGHTRQASLLAAALPRERFAVRCFSQSGGGPFADAFRQAKLPVLGHDGQRAISIENLRLLRHLLVAERPDLIHVWDIRALRFLWWATLLKRSMLPPLVVSLSASFLKKNGLLWWERWLLERTHAIVVPCEAERSALIEAGLAADKVRVIRPGVRIPSSTAAADFRSAQGIAAGDRVLMSVGNMDAPDRFHEVVQAFDNLRGVDLSLHLVLIGDGPFRQRLTELSEFAARPGLGVHFLGARPDAASLLPHADIVVVAHRRAGGTYAVLEAMAAGQPVVASNLPHLATLVRDGATGVLVQPGDPAALVRALHRLLGDEQLRRSLGGAARTEAAAYFGTERMASEFAALYDEILSGAKLPLS